MRKATNFEKYSGIIMADISCEPERKQVYSNDMRWHMVWQREVLGYKYDQIAANLNVHPSTVWRVIKTL